MHFFGKYKALRMVIACGLVSALLGMIAFFQPLEDYSYGARTSVFQREPSGEIVILAVDDAALRKNGAWPWDREIFAQTVRDLETAGAKKVVFDYWFYKRDGLEVDPLEQAAVDANIPVYFGTSHDDSGDVKHVNEKITDSIIGQNAGNLVYLGVKYTIFTGITYIVPCAAIIQSSRSNARYIPSAANVMAGEKPSQCSRDPHADIKIDYATDWQKIKSIPLNDLQANSDKFAGKTVIIAPIASFFGDTVPLPFHWFKPGALIQILGAETLIKGNSTFLGWQTPLGVLLVISLGILIARNNMLLRWPLALVVTALLWGIVGVLERELIFMEIFPSIFFLAALTVASKIARVRQDDIKHYQTDRISGLPNLAGHIARLEKCGEDIAPTRLIMAAHVANNSDIAAVLGEAKMAEFYNALARRIRATDDELEIFQISSDVLTWDVAVSACPDVSEYAQAMRAMMLAPFEIGIHQIRVDIHYGAGAAVSENLNARVSETVDSARKASQQHLLFRENVRRKVSGANWRMSLSSRVDEMLANGEFDMLYQPKYNLRLQKITGVEALMRWFHPGFGNVSPAEFIPAAEQCGAIEPLTMFAIRKTVSDLRPFIEKDADFSMAVNLSPLLLQNRDLPDMLEASLRSENITPDRLILELTEETGIMRNDSSIKMLERLTAKGFRLSIDDYGTGHSTLDYLRLVPASEVKLDRSFISDLMTSEQDRDVVLSTIELAHKLKLSVVAEGVEDRMVMDYLADAQCDVIQGYFISRPLSRDDLIKKIHFESEAYTIRFG